MYHFILMNNICIQAADSGLVVVQECRVLGLHCSSVQLHAGQVAVVKHGPRLKGCDLYFSRKPCSTCLKMLINGKIVGESSPSFQTILHESPKMMLALFLKWAVVDLTYLKAYD